MPAIYLPVEHVTQRNEGDCLVACAAMVLHHIGVRASYRRLRRILQIEDGVGTASFNINNLARLGVDILYQRGTIEMLRTHLAQGNPCIAFVQTHELPYWPSATDHALVVVGWIRK